MDLIVAIHTVSGSQCFQHIPKMSDCPCQMFMKIDDTEVVLTGSLAWFLFTTSFSLFFFTTKGSVSKNYLSTLHPTTAFGVQRWQLTLHSQDPCPLSENSLQHFKKWYN